MLLNIEAQQLRQHKLILEAGVLESAKGAADTIVDDILAELQPAAVAKEAAKQRAAELKAQRQAAKQVRQKRAKAAQKKRNQRKRKREQAAALGADALQKLKKKAAEERWYHRHR